MIRSKIDPSTVQDLAWKDYAKLLEKDLNQAKDKKVEKVPVVMISDFTFACGEMHTLVLLGKQSEMTKFFKNLKLDTERKKLKDFSIGFCHLDQEENGSHSIRLAIEGFGKPNKMKRNSKKLFKKLSVSLKEIIKGQYKEEVAEEEATTNEQPVAKKEQVAKKKRERQVQQITEGLEKIQAAIGQFSPKKLSNKLEHYQKVLGKIITKATEDQELDAEEQADFDRLKTNIAEVQAAVEQQATPLTAEAREKMKETMNTMVERLNKAIAEMNAF